MSSRRRRTTTLNSSTTRRSSTQNIITIDDQEEGDHSPKQSEGANYEEEKVRFSCDMVHKGGIEGDVPQSRQCHSAIYIENREEMAVFGGRIRKTHYSDELFVFNAKERKWTIYRNPRNSHVPWPHGRKLASLLYDNTQNCLFMFGGLLPSGAERTLRQQGASPLIMSADGDIRQTDLWRFDFDTGKWTCLSQGLPFDINDEQHVILQKSSDTLLVLGGQTMSNTLYEYDLTNSDWNMVKFDHVNEGYPTPPSLRLFSTVTRNEEMILFGGKHCNGQTMTNDIWIFNTQTYKWTKIAVDPDSELLCERDRTMVALVQNDFLVVYGGRQKEGHLIGDCYMFSFIDKRWRKIEIDNLFPGKVFNAVSVPIYRGTGMLMFGGHDGSKSLNCVYEFKIPILKRNINMASILSKEFVIGADLQFQINSRSLYCHSCIVSQVPTLFDLVQQNRQDREYSDTEILTIKFDDIDSKAFEQMLMFLYGKAPEATTADEIMDLGLLASKFKMDDLIEWCANELRLLLSTTNVYSILGRCHQMQSSKFEDICASFIASNPELVACKEFESLPKEVLVKVVRSGNNASPSPQLSKIDPSQIFQNFLKKLRSDASTSDLTIKTKDKDMFVHKVVLVFQSEYFATMFGSGFMEKSKKIIELPEISSQTMDRILDFMYTELADFKNLEISDLMDLAKGANLLLLSKLESNVMRELCMRVSNQNAFELLHFSRIIPNMNGNMLRDKCLDLVGKVDLVQHLFQFVDANEEMARELNELKRNIDSLNEDVDIGCLEPTYKKRKL